VLVSSLALSMLFVSAPVSTGEATGISSALPAGTTLGTEVAVSTAPHEYAVTYRAAGWNVGIVAPRSGRDTLAWHEHVIGKPLLLDSPEPAVFRLETRGSGPNAGVMYAFAVHGDAVASAIAGVPSGRVVSQESIRLHPEGFTTRVLDIRHVGSVRYRIARTYAWTGKDYALSRVVRKPDLPVSGYPVPSGWATTRQGNTILIRLEVADTEPKREQGLMYRTSLDGDSGMIFVWQSPVLESFWMENTAIPLSIAWLGADGAVQEIQDMQPETLTYHTPVQPYLYAIEANIGFFAENGVTVGDRFHILLAKPASSPPNSSPDN
jgi:uncharacterized membrane protein (UPF0127 family)